MGNPITLEEGDQAPLFTAEETNGETIALEAILAAVSYTHLTLPTILLV